MHSIICLLPVYSTQISEPVQHNRQHFTLANVKPWRLQSLPGSSSVILLFARRWQKALS